MKNLLKRPWKEVIGQDIIEYVLLGALGALAATAGMRNFATAVNTALSSVGSRLTARVNGSGGSSSGGSSSGSSSGGHGRGGDH